MFKEIKNNLQVNLLNQSVIELLIEKEILTKKEVEEVYLIIKSCLYKHKRVRKLINESEKLKKD